YGLRDDVDRVTQRFGAAASGTAAWFDGADESGTVTARVTAQGVVSDVRVRPGWRDRVGPAALAGAVLDALRAASVGRLEEWGRGMDAALSAPPPLQPAPGLYATLAGQLEDRVTAATTPQQVAAVEAALVEVMEELIGGIDELSAEVDDALRATVTGNSGKDRHVVAELSLSGEVVGLTYDEVWLTRAHAANVGRETLAAIDDARSGLAGRSVQDVISRSRLSELQAALSDPHAVSRRLQL
ncbi:MAG: hypothetical protein ACRCY8_18680, partial [Dermatophilaceae bacterium]